MHLRRVALLAEYAWLACVLLVHVVITGYCVGWSSYPDPVGDFVRDILPFAQFALLSPWLILGPGKLRWRWLAIPFAVGLAWIWSWGQYQVVGFAEVIDLLMSSLLLIAAIGLRLQGWRIAVENPTQPFAVASTQFSIRSLLIVTTIAGVAIAGGRWVYDHILITQDSPFDGPFRPWLAQSVLALALAFSSLGAGASVFGFRWFALAGPFTLILAGLSGTLVVLLLHDISQWPHFAVWMVFHTAVMQATLLPLRQLGYRLKRPAR